MWHNYINAFLGLCVMLTAFLGLSGFVLEWTLATLGLAIVIVGLLGGIHVLTKGLPLHKDWKTSSTSSMDY